MTASTLAEQGLATSSARAGARQAWQLVIIGSDDVSRQVPLTARVITIGADPSCDVVLDDPKVSRKHAEVAARLGGVWVRDLDSTNGTWWQGSRITEVVASSGAQLRFGNTNASVVAQDALTVEPSKRTRFGGLVGASTAMRELFAILDLASPTDATILLEGESGTGKEVAARAIHDHSKRAAGPFVVVDCSAISEQLIESHLFGHVKGSFTGASGDRSGAFVAADGGSIFLDEIGELPLSAQTKLLRVIEAQTVQPVGSDTSRSVDVRVVAASHRDLSAMVERQTFRFDLYYRLAVVHLRLVPLRERLEDLVPLVEHFYEGRELAPGEISGANLEKLRGHAWPGNVRELRNALERSWALAGTQGEAFRALRLWLQSGMAAPTTATEPVDLDKPFKEAKEACVEAFERRYVRAMYNAHDKNISRAASQAGINRGHLRLLLRKHGVID